MSKLENDASGEQQARHAEYIRHAINQVEALGGAQPEELSEGLGQSDPKQVGPYRILSVLGKGGMGKVYLAEQPPPLRRRVALKVIKPGMDTEQVLGRFEAERQALALLDHSNIAKVFDAGTTQEGRPYFAMEYIEGERITEYCDRHQLDTASRLRLFMQVCEGVQHAHQKAIIHRDIKPSNILVTEQDGKPVPKIIDFGVAKATEQQLTERSLQTEIGQIIGTLGYMSREQLRTPHDVDTRTDIYSLGVVLYELLVGEPPFDLTTLRRAARVEMERIIAEEEPLKPSTKLTSLEADSWDVVAGKRDTAFRSLCKTLRGDLDWITMKCLEKERSRRYDTANGLALEIARYLQNEPVLAGPPNAAYRVKKFVRRNKVVFASLSAVFVILLMGVAVSTSMYLREQKAIAQSLATLVELWLTEARALESEKRWPEAEQKYQALFGVDPTRLTVLVDMARMKKEEYNQQISQGLAPSESLLTDAVQLCDRALAGIPNDKAVALWNTKGVLLKMLHRYDEAIVAYQKAIEIAPDFSAAWENQGTAYALNKKLDDAAEKLQRAAYLCRPKKEECDSPWRNLAAVQLRLGLKEASDSLRNAAELKRNEPATERLHFKVLLELEADAKSQETLDAAIYADRLARDKDPVVKRLRALAYLVRGDMESASRFARAAIERGDRLAAADHLIVAISDAAAGRGDAAREALAQAEKSWPPKLRNPGDYEVTAEGGILWFESAEHLLDLKEQAERICSSQKGEGK